MILPCFSCNFRVCRYAPLLRHIYAGNTSMQPAVVVVVRMVVMRMVVMRVVVMRMVLLVLLLLVVVVIVVVVIVIVIVILILIIINNNSNDIT